MRVLDISVDLGPGASPSAIEGLVRAVRVATDVARDSESRSERRVAVERMRFPAATDIDSIARQLSKDLFARVQRHLELGRQLGYVLEDFPSAPPNNEILRRSKANKLLDELGYERQMRPHKGGPLPWEVTRIGLDVADPTLYQALVAATLSASAPGPVSVRSVRYQNPFGEEIVAVGAAAEKTLKATPGVIETIATVGSRRKIKKVEAEVAAATLEQQVEDAQLDNEIKREQLRALRIANERAETEHFRQKIEAASALDELDARRQQRELVERFVSVGHLDAADAVAALSPPDASALTVFAQRAVELKQSEEPDPDNGSI